MFVEDLTKFFDADDFAEVATFAGASVSGIFDNQFVDVHGVESYKPVFVLPEADVSSIAHGDTITIRSVVFKVVGIQADGTGLTTLVLDK